MVQSCNVNSWSYFEGTNSVLDFKKNQKIRFIPGFKQKWNPITSCEMPNPESSPTTSWTLHKLYKTNSFRSSESTAYHGLKNIQGMEPGTHILHTLLVNQLSHCFILSNGWEIHDSVKWKSALALRIPAGDNANDPLDWNPTKSTWRRTRDG